MISYIASKEDVALFVGDLLEVSSLGWQSITITKLKKSEDFYVHIAIDGSSEDTVRDWVQNYYGLRMNTSPEVTVVG